ncbi:MAG: hypothetical protein D4R68_07715 [Ignavibacteriales bacterium]|nr:MAG: hypothetical protein D4R68_07715 [Ignavibacteriales bacterium]
MIRKILLLSAAIVLLTNMNLFAQNGKDSTEEKWNDEKWLNWKDYDWFHWEFRGRPFMEINYGFGKANNKNLKSNFAYNGLLELKLGYASRSTYYTEDIIQFSEKYFFGSRFRADLKSSSTAIGEMKSDLWRFGFAKREGYAYKLNNFSIMPYNSSGFVWSRLDMIDYPAKFYLLTNPPMSLDDAVNDTEILNRFHQEYRFGTVNEAGIKFDIFSSVSLNVSYEAAVIFPRHLFWKHLGSMIIEESAKHLLGNFIDEVSDSSPYATPIVDFLLNNGLSYAFFTLKKDRMNWPFETEAPLTYEMIKLGITVTF